MICKQLFGTLDGGEKVYSYTLTNENGMSVTICSYGGAIMKILVPDNRGRLSDVVAGYDNLYDYAHGDGYLGALVGRTGNRIAKGKYTLDGVDYQLYINNGENSLHGGKVGFSNRIWDVKEQDGEEPVLVLTLRSADGEENYPGNLDVTVTYTLTKDNALSIHYEAVTDKKTIVNLTNHAYFNLGGYASGKIFDHVLKMDADAYLPTDEGLIPTGEIRSVEGTPFDFRTAKTIGQDFNADNQCLKFAGGYDHCFCFAGGETNEPVLRIEVSEPKSGRVMQVYTNQPCVQFYSGNFLNNPEHPLKGGYAQNTQAAFCLETQKMPDAINHPNFTNTVLEPGQTYVHTTIYKFSVR